MRPARAEAGYSLVLVVLLTGAMVLAGAAVAALARQDRAHALALVYEQAAWGAAEQGFRRALALLEVAPRWGTVGDPKRLQGEVPLGGGAARYEVEVRATGRTVEVRSGEETRQYPLVEVTATGRFMGERRALQALVYVRPPAYLMGTALSLYERYPDLGGNDQLTAYGDVYVSGAFDHRGPLCIEGDLIAQVIENRPDRQPACGQGDGRQGGGKDKGKDQGGQGGGGGGGNRGGGGGGGGTGVPRVVTGRVVEGLTAAVYRDRPMPPLSWYRWAQRRLWEDIYGRSLPPSQVSFQEMVEQAGSGQYPYGLLYVVDSLTIPKDDARPGKKDKGWQVAGQLTVVVNRNLTIKARKISYAGRDSHLVLISLGQVWVEGSLCGRQDDPDGPYGLHAFILAYDDREPAEDPGAGTIGPAQGQALDVCLRGMLAARTLLGNVQRLTVEADDARLRDSPAPAVPGMRAVVYEWLLGAPGGDPIRQRWRLD